MGVTPFILWEFFYNTYVSHIKIPPDDSHGDDNFKVTKVDRRILPISGKK